MAKLKKEANEIVQIETFTIEASKANEFATKMAEEMLKDNEWVEVGDFFPIILNNILHYTFTIRAGMFR